MGLIFVTYFFTAVLLFNSLYLSSRRSNYVNILLNKIEIPAAFASLAIAISIHLIFYGKTGIQQIRYSILAEQSLPFFLPEDSNGIFFTASHLLPVPLPQELTG